MSEDSLPAHLAKTRKQCLAFLEQESMSDAHWQILQNGDSHNLWIWQYIGDKYAASAITCVRGRLRFPKYDVC
jgi:hypothetical protein